MRSWVRAPTPVRALGLATALCCLTPAAARADGIFTPFIGTSFAESDVERVTTIGASLAAMAGGVFGFEIDFARTAEASSNTVFVDNSRSTMVTGNLIIGVPIKGVRPYVVGGLGWVRTDVAAAALAETSDGLAFDAGGGMMGFFSDHIGARFDLRYIRSFSVGDNFTDLVFDDLAFWRASAGIALRF